MYGSAKEYLSTSLFKGKNFLGRISKLDSSSPVLFNLHHWEAEYMSRENMSWLFGIERDNTYKNYGVLQR